MGMTKYWVCILTPENYAVVKEKLVWGVTDRHKNTIMQVKPKDRLIMYVIGEKKFKGIFEAISEPFVEKKEVFKGGTFPNRVKLKPVKISEEGIDAKKLVPKLKFFKRKDNFWAGILRGKAMLEISEDDYKIIEKSLK